MPMTKTVTIEEAQADLGQLIAHLSPNDQLLIADESGPIAEVRLAESKRPQPGICAGMVIEYVEDDEHLKDFEEYMN